MQAQACLRLALRCACQYLAVQCESGQVSLLHQLSQAAGVRVGLPAAAVCAPQRVHTAGRGGQPGLPRAHCQTQLPLVWRGDASPP